jgi:hypothetical protein
VKEPGFGEYRPLEIGYLPFGAARIAQQALANAIREKEDHWMADLVSEHPFSLRWCCNAISIAIGSTVSAQRISDHYFDACGNLATFRTGVFNFPRKVSDEVTRKQKEREWQAAYNKRRRAEK